MSDELFSSVSAVLRKVAGLMQVGASYPVAVCGAGGYNWQGAVENQHGLMMNFLRQEIERITQGDRTVREAVASLLTGEPPAKPFFQVVVCDGRRPEGKVGQLQPDDFLYIVFVPHELFDGLGGRRLK